MRGACTLITKLIHTKLRGGGESKFKTEVEEMVQNYNVELESFTDLDTNERTEPEVTESKFETEVENSLLTNC